MQSDFTFVLHCAKCGLNGEIEEYTLQYQCPECASEMRLSRIKTNISGEALRTRLRELLAKKERGDKIAGRTFALLADSPDPEVRKLLDEVQDEKYCRDHKIARPRPMVKLDPEVSGRSDGTANTTPHTDHPRTDPTSVTIPPGTTTIRDMAFAGRRDLTSVTIPPGVTTIGQMAFHECKHLTSVTIPEGVTTIGNRAFRGCGNLTCVTIPSSVRTIGEAAFARCKSLTRVKIPPSVTTIGDGVFAWCESLTSVMIPEGVKTIGDGAFAGCRKVNVSPNNQNFYTDVFGALIDRRNGKLLYFPPRFCGAYTIPKGVKTIGKSAFNECKLLTFVTIPPGVTTIGEWAFASSGLTSVAIPLSVKTIGDKAFGWCESLTVVTIPPSVKTIGKAAFYGCNILMFVTIPEGVTTIGAEAFAWCENLTSVTIPSSVTNIGRGAFERCPCEESVKKQFPNYN